jgi:hypothetical protein
MSGGRYYADGAHLSPLICPGCHHAIPLALANTGERTHATCGPEWRDLRP